MCVPCTLTAPSRVPCRNERCLFSLLDYGKVPRHSMGTCINATTWCSAVCQCQCVDVPMCLSKIALRSQLYLALLWHRIMFTAIPSAPKGPRVIPVAGTYTLAHSRMRCTSTHIHAQPSSMHIHPYTHTAKCDAYASSAEPQQCAHHCSLQHLVHPVPVQMFILLNLVLLVMSSQLMSK